MNNPKEFREQAHKLVDWMADYYENIESYPVKSKVNPGDITALLEENPPEKGESIEHIMADFNQKIMPGITHWQSPGFMAYFPANSSYPSVLAEMLTATLGAQCMIWETSPAAAEMEERMIEWLKALCGLPEQFTGVIQDTASTATLVALLTAREKYSKFKINQGGMSNWGSMRVYCSVEAHSSVEKAAKIAGLGASNVIKIAVNDDLSINTEVLEATILSDVTAGESPLCVIAALGTTGTTAVDALHPIADVCRRYGIWLHVDAAFAGSLLMLPEYRWMAEGLEYADSFVFNPHKWMFTNFDCSAYFVKDKESLINTFSILPEYLKTSHDNRVNNYRDWGIQLGRRFRALKLWFVIRNFGAEKMRDILRGHIDMAKGLEEKIEAADDFEMMAPRSMSLVCFRYNPGNLEATDLDALNQKILETANAGGKIFITHTRVQGNYTIRMVIGQTYQTPTHVEQAWDYVQKIARTSTP